MAVVATITPTSRTRMSAGERRGQLIAAALHEFAEQGYKAASTGAISQPYVYALFPNKQDLFLAVHDHVVGRIRRAFADAAALGDTPDDKLDRMGEVYPELIADRFALLAQLQSYATGEPAIQAHVSREYRRLYDEVVRLSGAPAVRVSLFFACGMLANVTTALGLQDICAPLFEASLRAMPAPPV